MANASVELMQAHWFNIWIVNDEIEEAWQRLRAAYIAATLSPACQADVLGELLADWGQRA